MSVLPFSRACTTCQNIRVEGQVQGVGFRPFVFNLAQKHHLKGTVRNDGRGVSIQAWGSKKNLALFTTALQKQTPPLARIDRLTILPSALLLAPDDFSIVLSEKTSPNTAIVPDAATCPDCLAEILDPANRRFRYAFINCTNCGPRFSITKAIPYDRSNTSMAAFNMCPACLAEYHDPKNRRFHAQPNACPDCGPRLWLMDENGDELPAPQEKDVIEQTAHLIAKGQIVAIKGIGGFHLACDATNQTVVAKLRRLKKRPDKPFALMGRNIEMVATYGLLSDKTRNALKSSAAPIVLLHRTAGKTTLAEQVAPGVAPGQAYLGFMLPYTPIHHLLMTHLKAPIVLTSANISDEPQVTDNDQALHKLCDIADFFLSHDRDIINRLDDSVVHEQAGEICILRRARGYAPASLVLPQGFEKTPEILAMGSELKNTFCLLKNGSAIVSQHLGDLENAGVHDDYRQALDFYQTAHGLTPQIVVVDKHPDCFSTRWGQKLAQQGNCNLEKVQHHHAHIAASMVEHGVSLNAAPVVGVALDGMGYGENGEFWGGEFLIADYRTFERKAGFAPIPVPGGEKAAREPWRNAYAHLSTALDWQHIEKQFAGLDIIDYLHTKPIAQIQSMIDKKLNAPAISSTGRLFDALAAVLGICPDRISFEGQAAMQVQTLAQSRPNETQSYDFGVARTISWGPMWMQILRELHQGEDIAVIVARFHNTLIKLIGANAAKIAKDNDIDTVVLSGGTFQNTILSQGVVRVLKGSNLRVLLPEAFPANDGGISLGQAVIAAARQLPQAAQLGG